MTNVTSATPTVVQKMSMRAKAQEIKTTAQEPIPLTLAAHPTIRETMNKCTQFIVMIPSSAKYSTQT